MTFASDLGKLSMPLREIAEFPDSILHFRQAKILVGYNDRRLLSVSR